MSAEKAELPRCEWTVKAGFTWCLVHGRYLLKCRR